MTNAEPESVSPWCGEMVTIAATVPRDPTYFNPFGSVVIRALGEYPDDGSRVIIAPENPVPLIYGLQQIEREE